MASEGEDVYATVCSANVMMLAPLTDDCSRCFFRTRTCKEPAILQYATKYTY